MFNPFGKVWRLAFISIILVEILSFLADVHSEFNEIVFWVILALALVISLYKLHWGIYIIFAELFIGSFGYLFYTFVGDFKISIRLGLFLVIFISWLVYVIRKKKVAFFGYPLYKYFLLFFIFLGMGAIVGIIKGNGLRDIFFDANGYLYFALVLVVFETINSWKRIKEISQIFLAAMSAMILKTIFLIFFFSHKIPYAVSDLYQWVRNSRVGEITEMSNNFYRIFFQGHIFLIITFFLLILTFIYLRKSWSNKKGIIAGLIIINFLSGLVIFTSYSRSFWVGFVAGLIACYIIVLFVIKIPRKQVLWLTLILLLVFALQYGLVWGIVNFPWPQSDQFIAWGSLIEERTKDITEEAAGASRFNLLPPLADKIFESPIIGSGFGAKVSFKTEDPRYLELHPDGMRTTYSFEWGYLDSLTEFGLLGLLAYILLLGQIMRQGWRIFKQNSDTNIKVLIIGLILGLFIIMVINCFTPYLNHPLGIGYLILMSAILYYLQKHTTYAVREYKTVKLK